MKLGILAAGAVEEIEKGLSPAESKNLSILVDQLEGEPMYDPIVSFFKGRSELQQSAIEYCKCMAFADGIILQL